MSGWFSLEAVYARKGDSLILHYGTAAKPRWILIDGGHTGVYRDFLRPRLEELRLSRPGQLDRHGRLPLEMVMVSHADEDHLEGILDLTANLRETDPGIPKAPVTVDSLWFNGFEDIIAKEAGPASAGPLDQIAQTASFDQDDAIEVPPALRSDDDFRAVVASTAQGRRLLQDAAFLHIDVNKEYDTDLVMRGGEHPSVTTFTAGLKFTVLGPDKTRVDELRAKWKEDLKKILAKESAADAASFADKSPFNLSSIIVLAERDGKTMLLTGDARGDDIIAGLGEEELLDADGKIAVDLFKLPHHGSDRNVKEQTFRDITAKHYVISANGEHDNPDTATLDMLVEGRKLTRNDPFTLHLTFPKEAFRLISEEAADAKPKIRKQKDALEAVDRWIKTKKPSNMQVKYRDKTMRSIAVDLGSESVFGEA